MNGSGETGPVGCLREMHFFFIFNYIYIERCTLKRDSCQNSSSVNWTP